jgi:Methylamine utilisation protein MauE
MIRVGGELLAVLGSSLLLVAGCTKLGTPRSALAEPLAALGVPAATARLLPIPLGLAEVAAALAILFERGVVATALVTALGALFLGVGVLGLRKGLNVPCHCLGFDRGRLGWRQVALFPFWILVAGLPLMESFSNAGPVDRWRAFLVVAAAALGVFCSRLAKPFLAVRSLRLALGPES